MNLDAVILCETVRVSARGYTLANIRREFFADGDRLLLPRFIIYVLLADVLPFDKGRLNLEIADMQAGALGEILWRQEVDFEGRVGRTFEELTWPVKHLDLTNLGVYEVRLWLDDAFVGSAEFLVK